MYILNHVPIKYHYVENNSTIENVVNFILETQSIVANDSVWHNRFGHPLDDALKQIGNQRLRYDSTSYEICAKSKLSCLKFPVSNTACMVPFEKVYMDLWGPYMISIISGARYILTIVDDCTRGLWTYLLHDKSQVHSVLQ